MGEELLGGVLQPEVVEELGQDLVSRALHHGLLHVVPDVVTSQPVRPEDVDALRLVGEEWLGADDDPQIPAGILPRDGAAGPPPVATDLLDVVNEVRVVDQRDEKRYPSGLLRPADKLLRMPELRIERGQLLP